MIFWFSTTIMSLLVILLLLLQTHFFQNYLAGILIQNFNGQTRHQIKVTNLKIKWFDSVDLSGLEVLDYKGNRMIYAPKVTIDYELTQLLRNGNLFFDDIDLAGGHLYLSKYEDTLGINLSEFIYDLNQLNRRPKDSLKRSPELRVANLRLNEFTFTYDNLQRDSLPADKFNYSHFMLNIPVAFFENFKLSGDTIAADIDTFVAKDPASGLAVKNLQGKFSVNNTMLSLKEMELETPHSFITNSVEFHFSGLNDLGSFTDSVQFDINLEGSQISKKDISYFADIPIADFTAKITAAISGSVQRLSMENLRLTIGARTHLYGDMDFTGLPDLDETFIDATINEGEIFPEDIEPFVGTSTEIMEQLGDIRFSGRFLGFVNDFVANANFQTDKGALNSDLNLKFPDDWRDARYSGKLVLKDFDVGAITKHTDRVRKMNLIGEIDGTGLTFENAKFFLNANFTNSDFFGYNFKDIKANGEFSSESFKGAIVVNDPNSLVNAKGVIDLKNKPEAINVDVEIDYLNLQKLGFVKDKLEISSKVRADVSGLNIDSLQGVVDLKDVQVKWKVDSVTIDSVKVSSFKNGDLRDVNVTLPELDLVLQGDFDFLQTAADFRIIAEEFKSYFEPDYRENNQLVEENEAFDQYMIEFTIDYQNLNEYLDLLSHEIYISPKGKVEGTYYQRNNATLLLFTEIDSINYKGIGYNNNSLDLNFSKDLDSREIVASALINSQQQNWRHLQPTQNLSVEAVWFNNKIDLNLYIDQPANNSSAALKAEMKLAKDKLLFSFLPSDIIAFGEQWFFNPYNKVEITQHETVVDRLELYQKSQSILLEGTYSDSSNTHLTLKFSDFNLETLNAIVPVNQLQGIFNSYIELHREDMSDDFKLSGDLFVNDFGLNGFPIGDITGKSAWDEEKKALYLDMGVKRESVNTIAVEGYYTPSDSVNQLDVNAKFNEASLVLLSPVLIGITTDISGHANGNVKLSGTMEYPVLNGEAQITNGRFKFDMLGTVYSFEGGVSLDNRAINFNGIRIVDRDGDFASLNGSLRHYGFKNITSNLKIAANNFMFLNTTASDNSLYYGTANATGDITITGPLEDLYIKAEAVTNKGTKIYIPLSGQETISQKNYISFVDFSDTTSYVDLNEIVQQNIAGVTLDFEIDVTSDAYVEMIFDIRTGDIIRGRGQGSLQLSLDTNGEFELFGDITISEGAYNFTIPNLINKEFSIVPGSTISWYGDPMSGILNLEATYRQLASFADFQRDTDETIIEKHAILVVLDLTGEMLSPNIEFEVRYDNSQGTLPTSDQLLLDRINNDEQELKRQVFSLLILRKFTRESEFRMGGAPVQGSLSEFLSNQFSYYISQVDENLDVDFDLTSLDQDAFNTFQLRLSYTFFDGRLHVSGGGAFAQNTPDGATPNGDFVGDWSVRYLLTPDGHLRVKAFSQSEQFAGDWQRESGVSFQYVKSFDDLKELLSKTREEAIRTRPKDVSKEKQANQDKGT